MSRQIKDPISGSWCTVAGAGGAIDNFTGTLAEWEALSPLQKEQYHSLDILDDYNGIPIDDELSDTSIHPVQNKVIKAALDILSNLVNLLPISKGGTGATTAAGAKANLELGTAEQNLSISNPTTNGRSLWINWVNKNSNSTYNNKRLTLSVTDSGLTLYNNPDSQEIWMLNAPINAYYASTTVKSWFDSTLVEFASSGIATIRITQNIAFVRIDKLKIKQAMSTMTKIVDGQMPESAQAVYTQVFDISNTSKGVIVRIYPDSKDLYLTTFGYSANEEISAISFSYPVKYA